MPRVPRVPKAPRVPRAPRVPKAQQTLLDKPLYLEEVFLLLNFLELILVEETQLQNPLDLEPICL